MKTKTKTLTIPLLSTTTVLFYLTIFALPLLNHTSQLLIGSAVNLMLFLGAKKLSKKELIPLAILPSLGAITNGVIFGSFTMFLVYFTPAIWLGNYLMMRTFNQLKDRSELIKILAASSVKTALLFFVAISLISLNIVPAIFIKAMGIIQLITAVIGGAFASLISKSKFFIDSEEI